MPLHIGIAACSAEGAALCYRTICVEGAQLLGGHAHPEVSMHTPSLEDYMRRIYRGDWEGVGEMMLASARKLAGMGADFVICPDNTLHQALPHVAPRSPLPWLHIAEAVMAEARARGYQRIGLSGTRWLMEGPVYPPALVRPDAPKIDFIITVCDTAAGEDLSDWPGAPFIARWRIEDEPQAPRSDATMRRAAASVEATALKDMPSIGAQCFFSGSARIIGEFLKR